MAGIFGGVMGQCGWGVMVEGALGVTVGEDLGYVGKGGGAEEGRPGCGQGLRFYYFKRSV